MNEPIENPLFTIDEETGIPILHLIPDKATCTSFVNLEDQDITSDEDIHNLILWIYHEPEVEFYYFHEYKKEENKYLSRVRDSGAISMKEFEYYYYKHPKFIQDYIKIQKHNIKWDWEREVMENSPMFVRQRILLSKAKERHLEILQKIEIEKQLNSQPKNVDELVITKLNWDRLNDDEFERLIYCLISDTPGYKNPKWLTQTKASDRGRDLSVTRVQEDLLSGTLQSRIIIQCKHWLSKSISPSDVSTVRDQMSMWEPPRVDVLIIATSGRFTSDAVTMIEKNNYERKVPYIEMWAGSDLERLLAARPHLLAEFQLR